MVRLAHFSDVHVSAPGRWNPSDWFSKRLSGWVNLRFLGRAKRFQHAERVLASLDREFTQRSFDHLIFSGDAGMIAFDSELAKAAAALRVDARSGLAVPGNHDHYLQRVIDQRRFEHYFAPWLNGERLDAAHTYPFAQRVGHVWLIAVNSSVANFWPWDASGEVGPEQRARLATLLASLGDGPRILVTHYPALMHDDTPEPFFHRLRDCHEVIEVARTGNVCLWLNGHRHSPYRLMPVGTLPFPMICAGSATQTGRWSYNEYQINDYQLKGIRRRYDLASDQFTEIEQFELDLRTRG